MKKKITIIVPTYNNPHELESTLDSIMNFSHLFDLYIIDSSSFYPLDFKHKNALLNSSKWIKPSGVYNAINEGINLCKTSYLMTLNSGDTANTQNLKKAIISDLYNGSQDLDIIVGAQDMVYKNIFFKEIPSLLSIWPHQSVIYKRELHDEFGFFNSNYKIISDQVFFEKIKNIKKLLIKFNYNSLTTYDITGISSIMNRKSLKEYKILNKLRGKNNFKLFLRYYFYKFCEILKLDFYLLWHSLKVKLKK